MFTYYQNDHILKVKKEIEAVEEKTSHSMRVLVHVDEVKNRVEQTCKALKEADNWSMLASAIEDIFKLELTTCCFVIQSFLVFYCFFNKKLYYSNY